MKTKPKTEAEVMPKNYKKVCAWDELPAESEALLEARCARYVEFLNKCKTERETIIHFESEAKKNGFKNLSEVSGKLKPGAKVYWITKNRAMAMAVIGSKPVAEGMRIVAAHHDVPHLDLKALPVYEKHGLALLKTHYYGGVKKFQWAAIPLAIHGSTCTKDGKVFTFAIGEKDTDPVFTITDIAPHLSHKIQNDRKATEVFKGEELTVLAASRPKKADKKAEEAAKTGKDAADSKDAKSSPKADEKVKRVVIEYLFKNYGLEEEDLAWSEISVVPAFKARYVGFDSSMIGAFGHDDKICVMGGYEAITTIKKPVYTAVAMFFDKEEIGSAGANGAQSMMISDFYLRMLEATGEKADYSTMRKSISETMVLSADTNAAVEPNFEGAYDTTNAGFLGNGIWICKFTGSGGKYNAHEAEMEMMARIRKILVGEKIPYQFGEMGKVDEGGGGTVAKYLAQLNMHVLDLDVPVLGLHSPFEVASKVDYHYSIEAYKAFFEKDC
ncbi:MAG: aminopeptidase [Candidatus Riflebacteria bacterium]|nr:aminopeptidase [Candidatus Riflebacteria bacterium]